MNRIIVPCTIASLDSFRLRDLPSCLPFSGETNGPQRGLPSGSVTVKIESSPHLRHGTVKITPPRSDSSGTHRGDHEIVWRCYEADREWRVQLAERAVFLVLDEPKRVAILLGDSQFGGPLVEDGARAPSPPRPVLAHVAHVVDEDGGAAGRLGGSGQDLDEVSDR